MTTLTPGSFLSPWGQAVATAQLKTVAEDFQVEEFLEFSPDGSGEHLWLWVQKRGLNTDYVAGAIAKQLQLPAKQVSYSGLKDRHAITRQWFSVHWPGGGLWPDDLGLVGDEQAGFTVLSQQRSSRKLRRGAHAGNHFQIVLREVSGSQAEINQRLNDMRDQGVPNYFGLQRFGRDGSNIGRGLALLAARNNGRRRRQDARESLWLSAIRSALFNQVLAARVESGSWQQVLPGDVLQLDGRGSFFTPESDDTSWQDRFTSLALHATGPLPGAGEPVVSAEVLDLERQVLAPWQETCVALSEVAIPAQRRALRVRLQDMSWQWVSKNTLSLSFALTSGAFATSVLQSCFQLTEEDHHALSAEQ
ncbi:MAG: tRNA pseudouridine(13) synthase TruD [Moraxellaceae bacterium]|nr:tRNA pseudouridine(13) synthase TruD [Moraxellaceae bacterium]MDZ4387891.1 tRNA pseudouridine(13) synthase TruD [Moraxellaceae bacterium]